MSLDQDAQRMAELRASLRAAGSAGDLPPTRSLDHGIPPMLTATQQQCLAWRSELGRLEERQVQREFGVLPSE